MELIYLWIEEYKNIKKQGFNFSPRFDVKYDEKENLLTIDEKKDYTSIFPNNIKITAIVGENGSGKSGILEFLRDVLQEQANGSNERIRKNFIFVKYEYSQLYSFTNIKDLFVNPTLLSIKEETAEKRFALSSNNAMFFNIANKYEDILTLDNPLSPYNKASVKHHKLYFYNQTNILQELLLSLMIILNKKDLINRDFREMFIPKSISLKIFLFKLEENELCREELLDTLAKYQSGSELLSRILNIYFSYLVKKSELELEISMAKASYSLNRLNNILQDFDNLVNIKIENIDTVKFLEYARGNEFQSKVFNDTENPQITFNITLKNTIGKLDEQQHNTIKDFLKIITLCDKVAKFKIKGKQNNNSFLYDDLSDGEKIITSLHALIESMLIENPMSDFYIVFDEFFNFLHPEWQRKILSHLTDLLENIGQKFHIIFTIHSPFMISDLPKENIIFLEKGKQVYPDIETFGANIHTLLSHGFFMKNGLMGEFAKSKIDKAIKYLNQTTLSSTEIDFCENIISIVGEPILKRQLQKMLDSKKIDYATTDIKDEIKLLKHRIALLSKRL